MLSLAPGHNVLLSSVLDPSSDIEESSTDPAYRGYLTPILPSGPGLFMEQTMIIKVLRHTST